MAIFGLVAVLLAGCATSSPLASETPASGASTQSQPAPSPTPALPDPAVLAKKLAKVSRTGIGKSGLVVLADDGTVLTSRGDRPLVPASALKIITCLAALDLLGPEHRFTTRVVSESPNRVVLVGGGDPLLTDKASKSQTRPASLQHLAGATAARLREEGVREVSLGYDVTAFSGPGFSPDWKPRWRGWAARIGPLTIGSGMLSKWRADPKPAETAAKAFAARLGKAGVKVTSLARTVADPDARELAAVQSAPVELIVSRVVRLSDNQAAEVLARHVAIAVGSAGSFNGAASTLSKWAADHGFWVDGMRIVDGSGLAERSRISPGVLAQAMLLALRSPDYAAVAEGLPVAGVDGTLKDRFDDPSERAGRRNVRAKTGTLQGIASLVGYLTSADGARLVFAAMANQSGRATAYNWLDRSAAVLAGCGCR